MTFSGESRGDSQRWHRPVWVPLDTYISHRLSHMRDLEGYFVVHDELSFTTEDRRTIALRGRVVCQHRIVLNVDKLLALDERRYVSAFRYKYHAMIGDPPRAIFRYDNVHTYQREGHPDPFHKHVFDPTTGRELPDSPRWIGIRDWPTLRQVLDELHQWWWADGQHLQLDD
jgi:hypothetical protein